MKKLTGLFLGAALLFITCSQIFGNGLNLNSLGSRALSMGGAYVALADDFSALFWNPAGIAQFQTKYFGFYATDILPSMSYKLERTFPLIGPTTLVDANTKNKHYLAGMAAYYHPITEKLVAGIGVYVPSGLGANWNGSDFALISNTNRNIEWTSKVGMVTFAPALAYKISDMVYIGGALNVNYAMFDTKMHAGTAAVAIPVPPYVTLVDLGQYQESMTGWGFAGTLGILLKRDDILSLGLTFRTRSKVKFDGDAQISNFAQLGLKTTSPLKRNISWPYWIAVGLAVKVTPKLTASSDIQFTGWKKIDWLVTQYTDPYWQKIMEMEEQTRRWMDWKNQAQYRFGAEYRLTERLALRAGYYLDPSPVPDHTMNVLLPSFDFNGLTFGVGYKAKGFEIDAALEYLKGKKREISVWHEEAMPGTYAMSLIAPNISIGYRFR
jgi:long-chain fatty acid transport protein